MLKCMRVCTWLNDNVFCRSNLEPKSVHHESSRVHVKHMSPRSGWSAEAKQLSRNTDNMTERRVRSVQGVTLSTPPSDGAHFECQPKVSHKAQPSLEPHTRQVRLKRGLVCLEGNGHRLLCHCRHKKTCSLSVDTSLYDPHGATRSFASALHYGVTATGLRARGTLLDESEPLPASPPLQPESTVTQSRSCCSHKRRQVVGDNESSTFKGIRGRVLYQKSAHIFNVIFH